VFKKIINNNRNLKMSAVKKDQPDDFFDPNKLSESSLCKYQVHIHTYEELLQN
jgi:hypothetical protein